MLTLVANLKVFWVNRYRKVTYITSSMSSLARRVLSENLVQICP